jgi:hypothetical protein
VTRDGARAPGPLAYFEEAVAGCELVVVVLVTCWGVVTRYVTQEPATWAGEVAGIAFAWMVFLGAAACFKYGMHVAIDMLVVALPAPLRRVLLAFVDVLVLAFLATLFVLAVQCSIDAWTDPTSVLRRTPAAAPDDRSRPPRSSSRASPRSPPAGGANRARPGRRQSIPDRPGCTPC